MSGRGRPVRRGEKPEAAAARRGSHGGCQRYLCTPMLASGCRPPPVPSAVKVSRPSRPPRPRAAEDHVGPCGSSPDLVPWTQAEPFRDPKDSEHGPGPSPAPSSTSCTSVPAPPTPPHPRTLRTLCLQRAWRTMWAGSAAGGCGQRIRARPGWTQRHSLS